MIEPTLESTLILFTLAGLIIAILYVVVADYVSPASKVARKRAKLAQKRRRRRFN
jgi:uncharacterized metal-binding protein